jgi:hypothetical protein
LNLEIHCRDALRSLRKGEGLGFQYGRCRRVGLVTFLQLVKLAYSPETPFTVVERNSCCRPWSRVVDLRS